MAVCYQQPDRKSMRVPTYFQSYIKFWEIVKCDWMEHVYNSFVMR